MNDEAALCALAAAASRSAFLCLDCGLDTGEAGHFYMVHDGLWAAAGLGTEGMVCLNCLEIRIGRRLTPEDFCLIDDEVSRESWPGDGERTLPECWDTDWRREQTHGLIRDSRQLDLFNPNEGRGGFSDITLAGWSPHERGEGIEGQVEPGADGLDMAATLRE